MSSPKLFVILGATGNQGGSVATTFLTEPGWQVRAVTRNTASPKAQSLAARGAQVIHADIDKPETLSAAFEGATAIFAVSDFWGFYGDPANKNKAKPGQPLNAWAGEFETQQLKNVIDAVAKVPTLERFILSSLSNATKWSKGKYTHVYHFDSKANAEDYGREKYPDLWEKTSIFQPGLFLSNYVVNPITQASKVSVLSKVYMNFTNRLRMMKEWSSLLGTWSQMSKSHSSPLKRILVLLSKALSMSPLERALLVTENG